LYNPFFLCSGEPNQRARWSRSERFEMPRLRLLALVLLGLAIAASAAPASAHRRHGWHGRGHWHGGYWGPRVFVNVAPFWWRPVIPVVSLPIVVPLFETPRVVVEEPSVYVQQPPPAAAYWYWCESEQEYYPNVPSCPEPWVPVPPRED
jgi:hypothetical protein